MKKLLSLLVALMMIVSLFSACGQNQPDSPKVEDKPNATVSEETTYKKAIRIGVSNTLGSSCPYGSSNVMTQFTSNSTFNGLVSLDVAGNATPELATSWESNADSTVWTFKLREGVTFHDGSPFTSADVKFTWEYAGSGDNVKFLIGGIELVDSIETPDDHTVVFNMIYSTPDWLMYMGQKIISKTAIEAKGLEEGGHIGTGPFCFVNYEDGVEWNLERYDNYWGELPVTEKITFVIISDGSAKSLSLQAGELDAIYACPSSDLPFFQESADYNVFREPNSGTSYVAFNFKSERGSNDIIRKAVAMAINREDVINIAYEGGLTGTAAYNFINNATVGYVDVDYVDYDPAGAKELLEKNGLENITLTIAAFGGNMDLAEIIQANLKAIGVEVKVNEMLSTGFTSNLRTNTDSWDMYINSSSSIGGMLAPMARMFGNSVTTSAVNYNDPEFDAMLEAGNACTSYEEKLDLFAKMQQYIADDVPAIALAQTYLTCVGSSQFGGVYIGAQGYDVDWSNCYVIED